MKLYTIKFANGKYLSRIGKKVGEGIGENLTEDLNEAYVYHDPTHSKFDLESDKEFFPGSYKATMEAGGWSYKLIEVKIVEV